MHIHLNNNPAKFHSNPICNDAALGFFNSIAPTRTRTTTTTVPGPKNQN